MIIHNFDPVFIDLGFFQIRWYALAYIAGIIIGLIYAKKIAIATKRKVFRYDVNPNLVDDLISYLIIGIILGGRIGYVLFYNLSYFIENPIKIFFVWEGGMSFHGGLVGVTILILFFSKKNNVGLFPLTDIISCAAPIGIFFGRLANFINGELYGKVTTFPWGVVFPNAGSEPRHPSQIYEAGLEGFLLFFIMYFLFVKNKLLAKTGIATLFFLIFYSLFRLISENFREPDIHLGYIFYSLSLGSVLSLITIFIALIIYFSNIYKK